MRIRNAVEKDFDKFLDLANNTYYATSPKGSPKQYTLKGSCIKSVVKDNGLKMLFSEWVKANEIIVFEDQETIFAYAIVVKEASVSKILDLMIKEEYQGKGMGTELVTYIAKKAREEKQKKIQIICDFEGAKVFWKRMGFQQMRQGMFEKIL